MFAAKWQKCPGDATAWAWMRSEAGSGLTVAKTPEAYFKADSVMTLTPLANGEVAAVRYAVKDQDKVDNLHIRPVAAALGTANDKVTEINTEIETVKGNTDAEYLALSTHPVTLTAGPNEFGGYPEILNLETGDILNAGSYKVLKDAEEEAIITIDYYYTQDYTWNVAADTFKLTKANSNKLGYYNADPKNVVYTLDYLNVNPGLSVTIGNSTVGNDTILRVSSDNATIAVPAGIVVVAIEGEAAVKAIIK